MKSKILKIEELMRMRTQTSEDHLEPIEFRQLIDEMITLKQEAEKKDALIANLQADAMSDALTGLANRRTFEKELERSIATSRRYERIHALLMIDVDNFKQVNDQLGHLTGDAVLRHVASLIRQNIRKTDIAARIGGDEFCVILNEIKQESNGHARAKTIADIVRQTPCVNEYHTVQVDVSVGCYIFGADDDHKTIMRRADEEMYNQKNRQKQNDTGKSS